MQTILVDVGSLDLAFLRGHNRHMGKAHPTVRQKARPEGKAPLRAAQGNGRQAQGSKPAARRAATPSDRVRPGAERPLTIHDLGWTREEAARVRAQMASFSADWDDPAMDVYNES